MYQCYEHVSVAAQKRTRSIADYFSASTKGLPVEKRPRGEETSLWFDLLLACKLSRKVIFFGCGRSLSAASKCRKTHPCDYRISKFSGGACPQTPLGSKALWALPILCPGVKLSCPPVENLNEPPGYDHRFINKRMLALEKPVWRERTRLTSPEVWAAATSKVWRDSGKFSFSVKKTIRDL